MPFGKGYDNIDDAAAAALMALAFQPRVQGQEYMTVLVKDPQTGLYRREAFQTQGNSHASEWTGRPSGPLAGLVHSHPAPGVGDRYASTSFSAADVNTQRETQVPSYVAAMDFAPHGKSQTSQDRKYSSTSRAKAAGPSAGEEFLAQFPIEELIAHIDRRNAFTQAAAATRKRGANPLTAALEK